ncbi:MAG: hypothetical protein ABIJ18_02135 [archaeon]
MAQTYEIQGSFAQNADKFKSLDRALKITNARRREINNVGLDNAVTKNKWYITGDNPIYTRQGLTFSKYPLILRNLDDAISQLRTTGSYNPAQQELRKALGQGIVTVDLSKVRFIKPNNAYDRFEVNISDPSLSDLNPEEQKLVHVPFGRDKTLAANFKMLKDAGKRSTRIWTSTHTYVMDTIPEDGAVAGLCGLNGFVFDSNFVANGRDVDNAGDWLRGVPNSAVGDTQKTPQEISQPKSETYSSEQISLVLKDLNLSGLEEMILLELKKQ